MGQTSAGRCSPHPVRYRTYLAPAGPVPGRAPRVMTVAELCGRTSGVLPHQRRRRAEQVEWIACTRVPTPTSRSAFAAFMALPICNRPARCPFGQSHAVIAAGHRLMPVCLLGTSRLGAYPRWLRIIFRDLSRTACAAGYRL